MRIADDELLSLAGHQMKPSTAWKFRQRLEQPTTAQSRTVALLYATVLTPSMADRKLSHDYTSLNVMCNGYRPVRIGAGNISRTNLFKSKADLLSV